MFRAKYVERLRGEKIAAHSFTQRLFEKDWVVYAKRPFANTHSVIEYLGRYTHKVAVSNHRVKSVDDEKVTFEYKDYRKDGKKGLMTLTNKEFVRRFALSRFCLACGGRQMCLQCTASCQTPSPLPLRLPLPLLPAVLPVPVAPLLPRA